MRERTSTMRKVWIIARNDLQLTLQGWQRWLLLIGIPVLVIYLVGMAAQGFAQRMQPTIRIDVLDRDSSAASRAYISALADANQAFILCPPQPDPDDACLLSGAQLSSELAQERLTKEITAAFLVIPEGFSAALERGDQTTLTFQPGASLTAQAILYGAMQNVATRKGGPILAARLSTELAQARRLETGTAFFAARLTEAQASWGPPPPIQVRPVLTAPNEKLIFGAQLLSNGFKLSSPSITVMFVMISILGMTQSLAEERMIGVLRRVAAMPISKVQYLSGKMLATFLVGWFQFAVLILFGEFLGVGLGRAPLTTMVVASAYVFSVAALALALSSLARTPSQASAIATAAWVVLVPLGGGWWPLIFVPPWMRTLGHLSPVAWCMDAFHALIFHQGTASEKWVPVGVLLLFAVTFFALGVKAFEPHLESGDSPWSALPHFGSQNLDGE